MMSSRSTRTYKERERCIRQRYCCTGDKTAVFQPIFENHRNILKLQVYLQTRFVATKQRERARSAAVLCCCCAVLLFGDRQLVRMLCAFLLSKLRKPHPHRYNRGTAVTSLLHPSFSHKSMRTSSSSPSSALDSTSMASPPAPSETLVGGGPLSSPVFSSLARSAYPCLRPSPGRKEGAKPASENGPGAPAVVIVSG